MYSVLLLDLATSLAQYLTQCESLEVTTYVLGQMIKRLKVQNDLK
jgi:hypothetical protein